MGNVLDALREIPLSDSKQDESFKVVDRRLFTPEGEFRKDVAEQQDRERETCACTDFCFWRRARCAWGRERREACDTQRGPCRSAAGRRAEAGSRV